MWALLDKAKYVLMGLAAPESKIDVVIATLKNKFDAPANLTFNKMFAGVAGANDGAGIIFADNVFINGIKFDLSNETIYGTTYAITTNNAAKSFSYAAVA